MLHSLRRFLKLLIPIFVGFCDWKTFFKHSFCSPICNQKGINDTTIKHFLLRNSQDNINIFDGKQIDFSVKLYTHDRPENIQSNPIHHSIKTSRVARKNVKKEIPNRVIYMAAPTFKKLLQIIKKLPPVVHFQPSPHFIYCVKRYICKDCLNIGLV